MSKYDEAIELLNQKFRLFDPEFDAVKFVPPRVLDEMQKWMELAELFPSGEDIMADLNIKSDLTKGE